MSNTEKMLALKHEISRLKKARKSHHARHMDIANLLDAQDKLRTLEIEASIAVSNNLGMIS